LIAGYLFRQRKSEMAANSGSRFTQPLIRIAVTFVITLPAIALFLDRYYYGESLVILTIYLIALIGYFAYEFITTKKIPNIIKMIPGLIIVAVLNIAFILIISISRNIILREINVDNVSSVTIVELNRWSDTYEVLNARGLEISDEQIAKYLAEALNSNIEELRNENTRWLSGTEMRVEFNMSRGHNITRIVTISDTSDLAEQLIEYEAYREIFLTLPEVPNSIWFWSDVHELEGEIDDLSEAQAREIYNMLLEEVQTVDFAAWYNLIGELYCCITEERLKIYAWIQIEGRVDGTIEGQTFWSRYPITELTPRTLELLLYYVE